MNNELSTNEAAEEIAQLEAEFAELEADFGDLGLDKDDQEAASDNLAQLEAALAGTEFAVEGAESVGPLSVLDIADGNFGGAGQQEGFLGDVWGKITKPIENVIKRRAARLIKRLIALVRKYRKYSSCVPSVLAVIAAFKARKYGTAVRLSSAAYLCIKSKS